MFLLSMCMFILLQQKNKTVYRGFMPQRIAVIVMCVTDHTITVSPLLCSHNGMVDLFAGLFGRSLCRVY